MSEDNFLDYLLYGSIVLATILLMASTAALGRQLADLQYQKVDSLNKVKKLQAWINIRIHFDRLFLAFVYTITAILGVFDVDLMIRMWVSRVFFVLLLVVFSVSAILDWIAELKQIHLIVNTPEDETITKIRLQGHLVNNKLAEVVGFNEIQKAKGNSSSDMSNSLDELTKELDTMQNMVRAMDPTYRVERSRV